MKVSLVVASGAHQGKAIPVPGTQLLIGRDPSCHLRPASPAISNKHCAVTVREGKVFVKDLGSTNGTLLNGANLAQETEVKVGDKLVIGPLDFTVAIEGAPVVVDQAKIPTEEARAVKPTPADDQKPAPKPKKPAVAEEGDEAAALLLAMGDDDTPSVPDGPTEFDLKTVEAGALGSGSKPGEKAKDAKADSASAARDLLSRYTRRPTAPTPNANK